MTKTPAFSIDAGADMLRIMKNIKKVLTKYLD